METRFTDEGYGKGPQWLAPVYDKLPGVKSSGCSAGG